MLGVIPHVSKGSKASFSVACSCIPQEQYCRPEILNTKNDERNGICSICWNWSYFPISYLKQTNNKKLKQTNRRITTRKDSVLVNPTRKKDYIFSSNVFQLQQTTLGNHQWKQWNECRLQVLKVRVAGEAWSIIIPIPEQIHHLQLLHRQLPSPAVLSSSWVTHGSWTLQRWWNFLSMAHVSLIISREGGCFQCLFLSALDLPTLLHLLVQKNWPTAPEWVTQLESFTSLSERSGKCCSFGKKFAIAHS